MRPDLRQAPPTQKLHSKISEVDLQPILDFARPMVLGDLSVAGIARILGIPCCGVQRLAETRAGIVGDVGSGACQNAARQNSADITRVLIVAEELYLVKQIEELHAELQGYLLPDFEVLVGGEVRVGNPG